MSENNNINPEELVEEISYEVEDATVVPTPIDPTLTISGEAADAAATGAAIAAVIGNLRVNTKAPVSNAITLYATDIAMSSDEGAQSISEAIGGIEEKDASDIMYDPDELISVKNALDDVYEQIDSELSEADIDEIFAEVFEEE